MARREVLDEEPLDIDPGGDEVATIVDLDEDDDDLGTEDFETEKKPKTKALTDDDLDRYEKERDSANERAERAEAAAREAADVAHAAVERLEKRGSVDVKKQLQDQKAAITKAIAAKRKELKAAFEDGDGDKHSTLTEDLADLKGQERLLLVAEEQFEAEAKRPRPQAQPKPHAKAQAWLAKNEWFKSNEEARAAAVMYGNMLERSGVSPATDAYYEQVDANMRKRFPEIFSDEERPARRPAAVRPVDREGGGGTAARRGQNKVKLTPLQVRIAKQWNIPKEQMAREVLKQRQRDNGEG